MELILDKIKYFSHNVSHIGYYITKFRNVFMEKSKTAPFCEENQGSYPSIMGASPGLFFWGGEG